MTERTFREPSPNRNPASDHRYDDAPPVPALPKGYMSPPPLPVKSNRRAASFERPPERVLSPPPLPNGRGVSLDRGPGMLPSQLKARTPIKSPQPGTVSQAERGMNRDSINFSRPISPVNSPPTSPSVDRHVASPLPQLLKQQASVNTPNVGKLRDGEADNILYTLQETAQAPVKKKKKKVAKNTEGSYLAGGGSGGRATGTTIQSAPQREQPSAESTPSPVASSSQRPNADENPRPLPKKKKKVARTLESPGGEPSYGSHASDSDSAVSDRSNATDRVRTYNTRAAGLLVKQPSIVREDREAEEQEDVRGPIIKSDKPPQDGNAVTGTTTTQSKAPINDKRSTPIHTKQPSLDIPTTRAVPMDPNDRRSIQPAGHQSLSPARAAHFSAQPILDIPDSLKHQPPARSISPVKSALKHSPSRGPSPVAGISGIGNYRRGPASEASDTTSMISDDGLHSVPKKKKSVRVSFDNESVVVGRAATPPTDPDSPMIMSPQNKDASTRRWLGLGKDHSQKATSPNRGQDTAIQPTPVLPSFGSVRGHSEQLPSVESTQNIPQTQTGTTDLGTSTDQRVGSILSRVFGSEENGRVTSKPLPQTSNDPLPPEVTSVEGTGYQSDTDTSAHNADDQETQITGQVVGTTANKGISSSSPESPNHATSGGDDLLPQASSDEVPSIAVQPATPSLGDAPSIAIQPATPGLDENQVGKDQYWIDMPGGFPTASDHFVDEQPSDSAAVEHRSPDLTPAAVGIAEPEPEAVAAQHRPGNPVVGEVAEGLRIQSEPDVSEESDNTNNSIYSDAAEDLSDLEGDGFGSINAIVESPASPPMGVVRMKQSENPAKGNTSSTNLRSIPLNRNESELSEPGSDAGWDQAQAYWSGLSQSRKQQIERAAAQGDIPATEEPQPRPKKKKMLPKKPTQRTPRSDEEEEELGELSRPSPSKAPSKAKAKTPAIKSSLRNNKSESLPEAHMRSSMRESLPAKSSTRSSFTPEPTSAARGALQKKNRPLSAMTSAYYNKPQAKAVTRGHDRSASLGTSTVPASAAKQKPKSSLSQPVRRTMSNGSDSSSSFKKVRPKTTDSGRYTMRRSMRGSSVDEGSLPAHGRTSSMASHTSVLADNTRRPLSSVGPSMRTSMRGSMDSNKPSRTKSPSRFPGFGKNSKPKAAAKEPTSRFSSRFADSSDEDDGPTNRRSRFADSSDEDEPAGLTPVRGIPRRIDEGDSTDLEDSSADEKATPKAKKTPAQQPTKPAGTALGAGSLRSIPESSGSPTATMGTGLQAKRASEKEKKRSFFGGLGSKKSPKSEQLTLPTQGKTSEQDTSSTKPGRPFGTASQDAPASPKSPRQQPLLGPGSPGTVGTENSAATGKVQKSPKLQRRISAQQAEKIQMKRGISDSWPLPQSPGGTVTPTMRPTTSDGAPKGKNGTIGLSGLSKELRPGLGDRQNTVETTATAGTGPVKKKKGWFKKAFGRGS